MSIRRNKVKSANCIRVNTPRRFVATARARSMQCAKPPSLMQHVDLRRESRCCIRLFSFIDVRLHATSHAMHAPRTCSKKILKIFASTRANDPFHASAPRDDNTARRARVAHRAHRERRTDACAHVIRMRCASRSRHRESHRRGRGWAADESTCKPGSVPMHASVTAIHLGLPLPTSSSGLPADSSGPLSNICAVTLSPRGPS